mgnify:CR=1 FL=1
MYIIKNRSSDQFTTYHQFMYEIKSGNGNECVYDHGMAVSRWSVYAMTKDRNHIKMQGGMIKFIVSLNVKTPNAICTCMIKLHML